MTLDQRIRQAAAANPAAPALIYGEQVLTRAQLETLVHRLTGLLFRQDLHAGMTVGLCMQQTPMHLAAMLALARISAVTVPVDSTLPPPARQGLVTQFGLAAIVTDQAASPTGTARPVVLQREQLAEAGLPPDERLANSPLPDTPLRVLLTSGTTRAPKGVLHTHGSFLQRVETGYCQLSAETRMIAPLLHTTLGAIMVMGTLAAGGVVIIPRTYDLREMALAVQRHAATHLLLAPVNAARMLQLLPPSGVSFPSLRQLRIIGAKPSPALLEQLRTRASPHLYLPYGITEVGVVAMATPADLLRKPQCTGRVQPWARVEIIDAAGQVLPAGQAGQVRARVEGMPEGYWHEDALNAGRYENGWFLTGDLGLLDDEGDLHVQGRVDDLLNVGGQKVLPAIIEEVLLQHPAVSEAGVYSEMGDDGTEQLVAAVVANGAQDASALAAFCRQHLPLIVPSRYLFVPSLPRNTMGKLVRAQLPGWEE